MTPYGWICQLMSRDGSVQKQSGLYQTMTPFFLLQPLENRQFNINQSIRMPRSPGRSRHRMAERHMLFSCFCLYTLSLVLIVQIICLVRYLVLDFPLAD